MMKKLYPLLSVLFLIYWGCEDPKEEETTPTEVTLWGVVYSVEDTDTLSLGSTNPLNLGSNQLTGPIPPEIGYLTNLTYLNLQFNQLTGSIPSEMWNLTNLTLLSLAANQLTGSISPDIGNLTNLEELYLWNNQFTGEIPESLCDLNLDNYYVSIGQNKLCPPYPSCIENNVGYQDTSDCD